jgi:hypothetical protein
MANPNSSSKAAGGPPAQRPLEGDPARQAIDSILGYDYQIWRTVEAWLRLERGQILYIECAEDYDMVCDAGAVTVQVKNSPTNITLNSEDVRDAVANFWSLQRRNTGRRQISVRFLTRGAMGKEKQSKFGAEKGLELWRKAAAGDANAGRLVAEHLLGQAGPNDLIQFLRTASAEELREALFSRIEWAVEEPSVDAVKLSVSRLAINLGNQRSTPPSVSTRAVPAILERCRQAAGQKEPELRSLTLEDAQLCFESSTTLPMPISNQLMAAFGGMGGGTALTFSSASFDGELPDLPVDGLPRSDFLAELVRHTQSQGCVLIVGSEGEGKSTAANMLARAVGVDSFWMDLRGGDESIAIAAVENALVLARSGSPPASIVLDDLLVAQGVSDAIWGRLFVLIGATRRAGIALAMTSKGVPVDTVEGFTSGQRKCWQAS